MDQKFTKGIPHFPALTTARTWSQPADHQSFLATFVQEPFSTPAGFRTSENLAFHEAAVCLLCARGGLAPRLPVTASENAAAQPLLTSSRCRLAAAPLLQCSLCDTLGISELQSLPPSLSPEKLPGLHFNSLWIPRTTEPPSKLSDALSRNTCFT